MIGLFCFVLAVLASPALTLGAFVWRPPWPSALELAPYQNNGDFGPVIV
jgi:hypothetical protein